MPSKKPRKRTSKVDRAANAAKRQRAAQGRFLAAFARCGNVTTAAVASRTCRINHYLWLKDADYAERFAQAQEEAADRLEEEARRRAVEGVQRLKFHNGQVIMIPDPRNPRRMIPYVEVEYSDALLSQLLRANRPDKYRDRTVEHKGEVKVGGAVAHVGIGLDWSRVPLEERLRLIERMSDNGAVEAPATTPVEDYGPQEPSDD